MADLEVVRMLKAAKLEDVEIAYWDLGDARGKKELLERALGIQGAHYGRDHPSVACTQV